VISPIRPLQEQPATEAETPQAAATETSPYEGLDVPTSIRRNRDKVAAFNEPAETPDMDYLDIPAFLRRQAD